MNDTSIKNDKGILIGTNIRKLRLDAGMKPSELIRLVQLKGVNMTGSALSKIEKNKQHITASQFKAVAQVLSCSPWDLLK